MMSSVTPVIKHFLLDQKICGQKAVGNTWNGMWFYGWIWQARLHCIMMFFCENLVIIKLNCLQTHISIFCFECVVHMYNKFKQNIEMCMCKTMYFISLIYTKYSYQCTDPFYKVEFHFAFFYTHNSDLVETIFHHYRFLITRSQQIL